MQDKAQTLRTRHLSEMLCRAIKASSHLNYAKQLSMWDAVFVRFMKDREVPYKELRRVLGWYCKQLQLLDTALPKWLHKCYNANMFCGAYPWIREHCNKGARADSECHTIAEALVSKFEDSRVSVLAFGVLLEWVRDWRDGMVVHLEVLVRDCWVVRKGEKVRRAMAFNPERLLGLLDSSSEGRSFHEAYGVWILRMVDPWDHWSGSLDMFALGADKFLSFLENRSAMTIKLSSAEKEFLKKHATATC